MTEQKIANYQQKLTNFRKAIDEIDEELISLLTKRMEVVSQVGDLKRQNSEQFFIKSNREADMIKNLLKKANDKLLQTTIVSIWRKIITNANLHEEPFKIAIHNPKNISDFSYLVREFYNSEVPILSFDSVNKVVLELENQKVQIAIFELPNPENEHDAKEESKENWWIALAYNQKNLRIFTKIPFVEFTNQDKRANNLHLVAAAIKPAERSESDLTLAVFEVGSEISRHQLLNFLKENGFEARILKAANIKQFDGINFFLVELEGFFEEQMQEIKNLASQKIKPFVKIIGHFPKPIQM